MSLMTEQATERVEKLGGKVVLTKRPEGKNGIFANVVDPEGNRFGVYQFIGQMA
jgi:predicted enzyme related to lactoylglutathione lyase